jgi:serine/alanine adding enzyme
VYTWLFGRFLVSLPFLNSDGVVADAPVVAHCLIAEAVRLADRLRVKYLELRHERVLEHPSFTDKVNGRVHMRLPLPSTSGKLWNDFDTVRRPNRRASGCDGTAAARPGRDGGPQRQLAQGIQADQRQLVRLLEPEGW